MLAFLACVLPLSLPPRLQKLNSGKVRFFRDVIVVLLFINLQFLKIVSQEHAHRGLCCDSPRPRLVRGTTLANLQRGEASLEWGNCASCSSRIRSHLAKSLSGLLMAGELQKHGRQRNGESQPSRPPGN